jgi:hypothetical protein
MIDGTKAAALASRKQSVALIVLQQSACQCQTKLHCQHSPPLLQVSCLPIIVVVMNTTGGICPTRGRCCYAGPVRATALTPPPTVC